MKTARISRIFLLLVSLLMVFTGCAGTPVNNADTQILPQQYQDAIKATKKPTQAKISQDLTPILEPNKKPDGGKGQVLMVTWTKEKYYCNKNSIEKPCLKPTKQLCTEPNEEKKLCPDRDTWFTLAPSIKTFCHNYRGDNLQLRLEQLLGLPPSNGKDGKNAFLEVWVNPSDLFRACPDSEINDSECQIQTSFVRKQPTPDIDQLPWDCPTFSKSEQGIKQVPGQFETVDQKHLNWMCTNWNESYTLKKKYPWTALGYTYDWGDPKNHIGLSEFVALKKTKMVFHSLTSTEKYCGREKKK
jgi:hypothetical protein